MTHKKRKTKRKRNIHTKKIGGSHYPAGKSMSSYGQKITSPSTPPFSQRESGSPPSYNNVVPTAVKSSIGYTKQDKTLAPKQRASNITPTEDMSTEVIATAGLVIKQLSIFDFLPTPIYKFIKNTYATIYINKALFKKLVQATNIQKNKFKPEFEVLESYNQINYDHARCLIYRYFDKNISSNYSYLRESKTTDEICEITHHIEERVKLYKSFPSHKRKNVSIVFVEQNTTKFTDFYNNKTINNINDMDYMKQEIQTAFKVLNKVKQNSGDENPYDDYSYLILYILRDIYIEIDLERIAFNNKKREEKLIEEQNKKTGTQKTLKGGLITIPGEVISEKETQGSDDFLFQTIMEKRRIDIRLCTKYTETIPVTCPDFDAVRYAAKMENGVKDLTNT